MWGDNSSIDSSASFFRWSTMVTSARFSCFVPLFLHQSAFFSVVMLCSFVSPDIIGSKLLDVQMIVTVRIIGASPVSNMNFYKLLRSKTHVVLYPGLYVKLCTER
ncbi:unnamed protein product [Brassica rapa subsp. narinosa]